MNIVRNLSIGLAACGLSLMMMAPVAARADVQKADFNESLDLPDFSNAGPRVLQNLGVLLPSLGPHLSAANEISDPNSWAASLDATFDATTGILSLTPDQTNVYQTIFFSMDNLVLGNGQTILGFAPISDGNFTSTGTLDPSIGFSFTANSISVSYTVPLGNSDYFFINADPAGTDTFLLSLSPEIFPSTETPEPGSLALLIGLGATGVMAARRRRQA